MLDSERLSRFVFESVHTRKPFKAFFDPNSSELSVSRTSALRDEEIWLLGDEAGRKRERPAIARFDFMASVLGGLELQARMDEPPRHHAVVVGWPTEREAKKLRAMELAAEANLVIR